MKVAILAGGQGTKLAEETRVKSKAMVRIGDQPILWHLLKYYEFYGYTQFVIALGYHADSIKEYFIETLHSVPVSNGVRTVVRPKAEPNWTVELIDTGLETMSGGRIKRLAPYLDGPFMLTWCDGLADVDLASPARLSSSAWPAGNLDRRPSACALRPPHAGGRADHRVPRKDARSGRVDQRRLLRP